MFTRNFVKLNRTSWCILNLYDVQDNIFKANILVQDLS